MRYFTKEWYHDSIVSEMCFQMRKDPKAAKFSEKYFQSLYSAQESWYVKHLKRAARHSGASFDPDAAKAEFEASYQENLKIVKAAFPAEILDKVADVRVLAMGNAEYGVLDEITRYCGKISRRCDAVSDKYEAEVEKLAERMGWFKINSLNMLANAPIVSAESDTEGRFVLKTSPEVTEIACRVTLYEPELAVRDEELVDSTILHFEILPTESDGSLELNLLCKTPDGRSAEFSARMKELDVEELFGN